MISHKDSLACLTQKYYPHKVQLRDDYEYPIKGMGESSYKLKSGNSMKMKEVLYVTGLKKNILSISALDKKGFIVSFIDGVLMWTKGRTINDAIVIGVEVGGFYKLKGHPNSTFIYSTFSPCELWYKIISHVNYKELIIVRKVVTSLT